MIIKVTQVSRKMAESTHNLIPHQQNYQVKTKMSFSNLSRWAPQKKKKSSLMQNYEGNIWNMDDHHQYYYALTYCLEVLAYDDLKPSQLTRHKNKQRGHKDRL